MFRYLLRRVAQVVPLVLAVVVVNFVLIHLAPGDPASAMAGENASPEYQAELRERFGLDKPIHVQLFIYLGNLLTGDLGHSFTFRRSVVSVILERMPATLLLLFAALVPAIILGTLLGATAAHRRGRLADKAINAVSLGLFSVPVFWSGMVAILVFSLTLGWFPTSGMRAYGAAGGWLSVAHHLALPAAVLGLHLLPTFAKLTRSAMLSILDQDFIRTSRAIGFRERTVIYRHALRNALLPTITIAGLSVGILFAGALLTETVFAWPGMGQLMYRAVFERDYPLLMGTFLMTAVAVAVCMLLADLAYALVDPRVRMSSRGDGA